jgi:hypothetical protein
MQPSKATAGPRPMCADADAKLVFHNHHTPVTIVKNAAIKGLKKSLGVCHVRVCRGAFWRVDSNPGMHHRRKDRERANESPTAILNNLPRPCVYMWWRMVWFGNVYSQDACTEGLTSGTTARK